MTLINSLRTKNTVTQNNALTNSASLSGVLDFFAQGNAMRNRSEQGILDLFLGAVAEDNELALKALFYSRDIRQGQGERRTFRVVLEWLGKNYPDIVQKNLHLIPFYGRWDDLFVLLNTGLENDVLDLLAEALNNEDALAAKWMPRESGKNKELARYFMDKFNLSAKEYRQILSTLSNTVEQKMCANEWDEINYSHVPSLAMIKYRKAFPKHSPDRWLQYVEAVKAGKAKVNASTLYPHDIVRKVLSNERDPILDEQWKALPSLSLDSNTLVVCDTSGSMSWGDSTPKPIEVAVALAIYLSEHNEGQFKDAFITFSEKPSLQYVNGRNIFERVNMVKSANWGGSTNLEAVFSLILKTAIRDNLPESEMPGTVLIISDMEFNQADRRGNSVTLFDSIHYNYADSGYKAPNLVFWNVDAKTKNFPVQRNQAGAALISGFSPNVLRYVLSGKAIPTPYETMLEVLNSERYSVIDV